MASLLEGVHSRQVSVDDLERLQAWAKSRPDAPDGDWHKHFGTFILCGTGAYPKTVLAKHMKPCGDEIE